MKQDQKAWEVGYKGGKANRRATQPAEDRLANESGRTLGHAEVRRQGREKNKDGLER